MGRDKARLPYHAQTFLTHLAGELRGFDELLVSVENAGAFPELSCRIVEDERKGFGPVEGIYQMLRAARNPYLLVVATDMQQLTAKFLQDFTAQLCPGDQCMVVQIGDLLEPLCAVYHKDALPALERLRCAGIHRPRAIFKDLRTRYVDLEALGYQPELMANVNTPEEYQKLL